MFIGADISELSYSYIGFNYILSGIAIGGFFLPTLTVMMFRNRRINKFNRQLVDSLNAMSNAFKAGLTFPQAMEHVVTAITGKGIVERRARKIFDPRQGIGTAIPINAGTTG